MKENVPLKDYSYYKIDGPARYFFEVFNFKELKEALDFSKKVNYPVFVLGGGSNILFPDEGLERVVIKINLKKIELENNLLKVSAGVMIEELLNFCLENSLKGLEWAGGLPGTLGGAIRGNAGAFGYEIKDVVEEVISIQIDQPEVIIKRKKEECHFNYRSSIFKEKNDEIILETVLKLEKGDKKDIEKIIKEKIKYREEKHPLEYPNIGSIFKNVPLASIEGEIDYLKEDKVRIIPKNHPELVFEAPIKIDPFPVIPTAFLISEVGLKGVREGQAMISEKHPNFIVNLGEAKAQEVKKLIQIIKEKVYEKFLIKLEEEVIILENDKIF